MLVAASAASAFADRESLAGRGQVADQVARLRVEDDRPRRDEDDEILAALSRLLVRAAAFAIRRGELLVLSESRKRVERGLDFEDDIAALAAVAAIGTAARLELLAAKVDHAVAALAGTNVDFYVVNEHSLINRCIVWIGEKMLDCNLHPDVIVL